MWFLCCLCYHGSYQNNWGRLWAGDQCGPDLQTLFRDGDSSLSLSTAFILSVGCLWTCMEVFLNTALDVPYHPPHSQAEKREVLNLFCSFSLLCLPLLFISWYFLFCFLQDSLTSTIFSGFFFSSIPLLLSKTCFSRNFFIISFVKVSCSWFRNVSFTSMKDTSRVCVSSLSGPC